jgi:hypothetical protein
LTDIFAKATPWFDEMFQDVLDGYPGGHAPNINDYISKYTTTADLWYVSNPTASVSDLTKGQKVLNAFEALLDAASG